MLSCSENTRLRNTNKNDEKSKIYITMENNFTTTRKEIDAQAIGQIIQLFPNYEFREKPAYFVSPKHYDGTPSRHGRNAEKLFIYKNAYNVQENGGSLNASLYDFFCNVRGLIPGTWESLNQYADAVGYKMPDTQEAKEARHRQEMEERARQAMENKVNTYVSTLNGILNGNTPEGDQIRAFLNYRGWSAEYLTAWRIGYDVTTPTNPLTFPIFKNGKACQIARRWVIDPTPEQMEQYEKTHNGNKYPAKFKNETGEGKTSFLGFAPILANVLFIAEGIPDAMALNANGFAGACTFSNNINNGQLSEIRQRVKRGLKSVYLIADKDQAGDVATPRNGRLLTAEGLNVHIITFADVEGVKDADDYFYKAKHTPQDFQTLADTAPTFAEYMQRRHRQEYQKEKDLNKYFDAVAGLMVDATPADYMAIYGEMERNADADGYLFPLFERVLKAKEANASPQAMADASRSEDDARAERAKGMFEQYQAGDVWKRAGVFSRELNTGYTLETLDALETAEPWTIPADDLTLICGYTSHGKTKVLQNLFLRMAEDPTTKGRFLFVSYEESDGAIIREMVNIKVNKQLTENPRLKTNVEEIGDFIQTGGATSCNGYAQSVKKALDDLDALATSGRVTIVEDNAPVEILADAIRHQVEKYKGDTETGEIKAVFVDYVQLLEMENPERLPPNIILKNIALTLHNVAKQTQTAIICGAQLKREEKDKNPVFITESDVADSAYLERTGAEVVIIYDGNKLKGREFATLKESGKPKDEGQKLLLKKGFACPPLGEKSERIEADGRLYVKICKHRGRRAGVEGVLCYTPATGNICQLDANVWASPVWNTTAEMWGMSSPAEPGTTTTATPGGTGGRAVPGFNPAPAPKQKQIEYNAPASTPGDDFDGENCPF